MLPLDPHAQHPLMKIALPPRPLQHPHLVIIQPPARHVLQLLPRHLFLGLLLLLDLLLGLEARLHAHAQRRGKIDCLGVAADHVHGCWCCG